MLDNDQIQVIFFFLITNNNCEPFYHHEPTQAVKLLSIVIVYRRDQEGNLLPKRATVPKWIEGKKHTVARGPPLRSQQ